MANQIENQAENEIDLIEVFGKLWDRRKFILKITVGFMVFGVLVALFSSKEYTAGCTIVPQTGESEYKRFGRISGYCRNQSGKYEHQRCAVS